MATTVNTIGLIVDILGAIILLNFGLPPKVDPEGHINLILEQEDEEEKKLGKKIPALFQIWSYINYSWFFTPIN